MSTSLTNATTTSSSSPRKRNRLRKRGALTGALVLGACAVACSIPLIAGAGILSLGAGAFGGTRAFFAVALLSLLAITGVVWVRRRRASQAADAHAISHRDNNAAESDSCKSDHTCAGSGGGCGCS